MRPIDRALPEVPDLATQILAYASLGVIHSDDECFFCGCYINSEHIETLSKKVLDKPDTFFVYICAGNIEKAFKHVEPAKNIAFERNGKVRLYDFNRFRRLACQKGGTQLWDLVDRSWKS